VYRAKEPARSQLKRYVKEQFDEHKNINRLKFHQVEYRFRQGKNKFEMIKECGSIDGITLR
jgi:succinate dehydrogenase assembly factor 1